MSEAPSSRHHLEHEDTKMLDKGHSWHSDDDNNSYDSGFGEQDEIQRGTTKYSQIKEVVDRRHPAKVMLDVGHAWMKDLAGARWLPILTWGRTYNRKMLFGDAVAGLTIAVMLVPQGLAYSALAGLPPVYGLYSSLIPLVVYTLFATAMRLTIGPAAPTCIMIASAWSSVNPASQDDLVRLAFTMAFVGGVFQLLLGLLRAGAVANLLSWPVKSGYMAGAAFLIMASQLQDSLGLVMAKDDNFFVHVVRALIALPTTNWRTLLFTVGALVVLFGVRRIKRLPEWFPTPLLLIIITSLISYLCDVAAFKVKVVGVVPSGLPTFQVPFRSWDDIVTMIPTGISVSFVAYVGSISLALVFARDPQEVDANQELVAFGVASIVGSFCSSFLISGSFSRAAVNVQAGAESPASNTITAIFMFIVLMLLAPFVRWLPVSVLACIIIAAASTLVKVQDFKILWRSSPPDFLQCVITFIVVLIWGLQTGIAVGVGSSIAFLVLQSLFPRILELGQLPDRPDVFMDANRFPETIRNPQVRVVRVDSSLHFANVGAFASKIREILAEAKAAQHSLGAAAVESPPTPPEAQSGEVKVKEMDANMHTEHLETTSASRTAVSVPLPLQAHATLPLKAIVIDCIRIVQVDATACQTLKSMIATCNKQGIQMLFSGAPAPLRSRLRQFGLDPNTDSSGFFLTVQEAMSAALERQPEVVVLKSEYLKHHHHHHHHHQRRASDSRPQSDAVPTSEADAAAASPTETPTAEDEAAQSSPPPS